MKLERLADSRDELYNIASHVARYEIYVAYVLFTV